MPLSTPLEEAFFTWLLPFGIDTCTLSLGLHTFPHTGRGTVALRPISVRSTFCCLICTRTYKAHLILCVLGLYCSDRRSNA